jgi:hypothetical protein
MDKCWTAMNIRCDEQIVVRKQVISQKVLNFYIIP